MAQRTRLLLIIWRQTRANHGGVAAARWWHVLGAAEVAIGDSSYRKSPQNVPSFLAIKCEWLGFPNKRPTSFGYGVLFEQRVFGN
eukprot:4568190-Amphidinium_carterae.1